MQDLLSQDEIDALLHGVDDGDIDTYEETDDTGVKNYDLASQDRIVRGRMPTLEMINERFARYTRISLFNLLRRNADVSTGGVQIMKFGEYIHTLYVPTSLNLCKVRPLRGTSLFVLDAKLVSQQLTATQAAVGQLLPRVNAGGRLARCAFVRRGDATRAPCSWR